MLEHVRQQLGQLSRLAGENLAFSVYDILLQVVGDRLAGAEVFHSIGNVYSHLFGQTEEMVYSCLCSEYDSGVFAY